MEGRWLNFLVRLSDLHWLLFILVLVFRTFRCAGGF